MTDKELAVIITNARVEENVYWSNRAHPLVAKKHEARIQELLAGGAYRTYRKLKNKEIPTLKEVSKWTAN